jgi:hypothetical protein
MSLSKRNFKEHKKNIELSLRQTERQLSNLKVNHILHLLLSILTAGFWAIVWIVLTIKTNRRRAKLEGLVDEANTSLADIEISLDELE